MTKKTTVDVTPEYLPPVTIKSLIDTAYKDYSLYVIRQRAIPCYIDGFKTVQRKLIRAGLDHCKNKKIKVAELGSSLSSYDYLHGETSAQDALTLMAANWCNNVPLFEAHGNFGTRLIQEAASPRYIYVKLSENFNKLFCDNEVVEYRNDQPEPITYLPLIPMSLINGISGMAVGFACNILPHDYNSVLNVCTDVLRYGKSKTNAEVLYPGYKGEISLVEGSKYMFKGIVEKVIDRKKISYVITELPPNYDRLKYYNILIDLRDKGVFNDFDDECNSEGFRFIIYASDEQSKKIDKDIYKTFKLINYETQNLTTIDENGQLIIFNSTQELIERFVNYRLRKTREYIDFEIAKQKIILHELTVKRMFIQDVLDNKLILNKHVKTALAEYVVKYYNTSSEVADKVISIPSYSFTSDNIEILDSKISEIIKLISELEQTNEKDLYLSRLKKLKSG